MEFNVIEDFLGNTYISVVADMDINTVTFEDANGKGWVMYHEQDCCESVVIEDIVGDLKDLENSPILMAEERVHKPDEEEDMGESTTYSFYTFATIKGYVDIRFVGTSNGYYSETVEFREL